MFTFNMSSTQLACFYVMYAELFLKKNDKGWKQKEKGLDSYSYFADVVEYRF